MLMNNMALSLFNFPVTDCALATVEVDAYFHEPLA